MQKVRKQKRRPKCIIVLKDDKPDKVFALSALGKLIVDEDNTTGFKTFPCINKKVDVIFPTEEKEENEDMFSINKIESTITTPDPYENFGEPPEGPGLQLFQWNEWASLDMSIFEKSF